MDPRGGDFSPTLSVAVMARSGRQAGARALAAQLTDVPVRIVSGRSVGEGDPITPSRVAKVAWQPWTRTASHHLVVQDDVVLHPEFLRQVKDAVAARPDAVLSFFTEWGSYTSHALRVAAFSGRPWVAQPDDYLSTIAMAMPAGIARAFAESIDSQSPAPDDETVFDFVRAHQLPHFASNPNLVQLAGPGDASRATAFLPELVAPARWWTGEPLTELQAIPAIDWQAGEPVSFEAGANGGPWTVRPRRESTGPHARRLTRIARDRLLVTRAAGSDLRAAAAMLGAATVLCDQLVVASAYGPEPADYGESCARESAATLPVGTLRSAVPALEDAEVAAEVRAAFLAIHDDAQEVLRWSV